MVFFSTRNLYRGSSDDSNDEHNHGHNGGSAQDLWDRDEGVKAGISKSPIVVYEPSLNRAQKSS
jgi:hypothetical protein